MKSTAELLLEDPMARYRPKQKEAEQLCEEYGIGKFLRMDEDLGGLFNINQKITAESGEYVIRVHSGFSRKAHLLAERALQERLAASKVPVLAPIATKEGTHFSKLHNRFVQITPFVQGASFRYLNEQVYNCGNILRIFHDSLSKETEIPTPLWSNYPRLELLNEGMDKLNKQVDLHGTQQIKEAENLYLGVMDQWLTKSDALPKGVIHADWHPWNLIFNENHSVKYILDFDFLQMGERIHDIAYFLWTLRNESNHKDLGRQFLKGYGPLSTVEMELLPVAIARASLFFVCTASFVTDSAHELKVQLKEQKPFIKWLLTREGKLNVMGLFTS